MARRTKGEGSITQRQDGSWQGALQIEGRRRFVTGRTEQEIKAELADLQRRTHQNGGLSDPGSSDRRHFAWTKRYSGHRSAAARPQPG